VSINFPYYILQVAFSYESVLPAFLCLQFGFEILEQKNIIVKAACKMLVKSTTTSVNFTKILQAVFI